MTTLYKPVLIETAEQAEALPDGARVLEDRYGLPRAWAKSGDVFLGHGLVLLIPREVVGMQALVPIEAEEGTDTIQTGAEHFYTRTRYVTPWESV